eukprot:EG_transcript_34471
MGVIEKVEPADSPLTAFLRWGLHFISFKKKQHQTKANTPGHKKTWPGQAEARLHSQSASEGAARRLSVAWHSACQRGCVMARGKQAGAEPGYEMRKDKEMKHEENEPDTSQTGGLGINQNALRPEWVSRFKML